MRSSYLISLVFALVIAGTYWYQSSATECPAPIYYSLGNVDDSFNISSTEALVYISQAEKLWENEVDRELFVYDETADFTIDFIFDERQAEANSEASQRDALDKQREDNEKVLNTVESLQSEYQNLSDAYRERANEYEEDLVEYNDKVNKYNDRGGAPPDVFRDLEEEKEDLSQEVKELSVLVSDLNNLASEINRLSERGNSLVEDYNREVTEYNAEFGFAREFTQGDYQDRRIHVYKFSSENELVTVLAHEFGHALGIDHVEGSSSLMYYLLEDTDQSPVLAADDLAAYRVVCGLEETTGQKIRRTIREFLAVF